MNIIYVLKTDGEIVMAPRRNENYLPHPYLAGGEDVLMAGTLRPGLEEKALVISNKSGHYKPSEGNLSVVATKLEEKGYNVYISPFFFVPR